MSDTTPRPPEDPSTVPGWWMCPHCNDWFGPEDAEDGDVPPVCYMCRKAGVGSVTEEPRRRGSVVRDREGDLWRRGNTRWSCLAVVDGRRVTNAGRLPWYALKDMYGPLTLVEE